MLSIRYTVPAIPVPLVPRWLRYLGAIAVAGALFYFSVLSAPPVAPPDPGPFWDKQLHFLSYGGFTLALAYATTHLKEKAQKRILLVVSIAIAYGLVLELLQGLQPQRYLSIADALANVVGTLLASLWFGIESRVRYIELAAVMQ